MGKFDIDKTYEQGYTPRMNDLCKEISSELEPDTYSITIEELRHKFKNSDKSGLIDKLKKLLSYDIEKNAGKDLRQKFAMMQILKLIYMLDKKGCLTKEELSKNNTPIHIIDILSKPCFDNITTITSSGTVYGKTYYDLLKLIGNKISNPELKKERITIINHKWEQFHLDMFFNVITDYALAHKDKSLENIKKLYDFLNEHLLPQIDIFKTSDLPYKEDIFTTFYNILCTHYYLCCDMGRFQINDELTYDEKPTERFIQSFRCYESRFIDYTIIDEAIKHLMGKKCKEEAKLFLKLISYDKGFDSDEVSAYIYALNHAKSVIRLIEKNHNEDLSHEIDVSLLITVVQEIIYVKKNKDKLTQKHHNHNSNKKSFISSLLDLENADVIIADAWHSKIQNRLIINFGMKEHLIYKRKIESIICKIKAFVYSHKNLEDMEEVNDLFLSAISQYIRFDYNKEYIDNIIDNFKNSMYHIYFK